MPEILITASLVAAFIAGLAALFAPCCITVLLPAYLGSIFRERKTILLMTLVFFFGLLAVFLPLGLGMAWLGTVLNRYHDTLFITGGIFLALLGISILLGIHFSLPFTVYSKGKITNAGSVFVLGIFSAAATLCCAPVLGGVLALSALPGSLFWGGMYAFMYVVGMVTPLFIIAYFLDKTQVREKFKFFRRHLSYALLGKKIEISISDILSGVTFVSMGILILYLAVNGKLTMSGSEYQLGMNIFLNNLTQNISAILIKTPLAVKIGAILAVFLGGVYVVYKKEKRKEKTKKSAVSVK